MPVLLAGRARDDIAGSNEYGRLSPALGDTEPGCDNERLAERMRVPSSSSPGLEGDARSSHTCRCCRLKKRVDPYRAAEVLAGAWACRLRATALCVHERA